MVRKCLLLLLASFLLLTTRALALSTVEEQTPVHDQVLVRAPAPLLPTESNKCAPPGKPPVRPSPPVKPPVSPPVRPVAPPVKPPMSPPVRPGAPVKPPVSPVKPPVSVAFPPVLPPAESPVPIDCAPKCMGRCKWNLRRRHCYSACMECCDKCKCVPPGIYLNRHKCGKCYTRMTNRHGMPMCP